MKIFFKKHTSIVPEETVFLWSQNILDTNLLNWGGYKTKQDYEYEMGEPYNKDNYIKENIKELEKIYLIRQNPDFQSYARGGSAIRSVGGERPILRKKNRQPNNILKEFKNNKNNSTFEYTIGGL